MDVTTLLKNLEAERDSLDATIKTLRRHLQGSRASQSHAKAPGAKPQASVWTPARRLAMSKLVKARIAAKKKAATK